MPTRPNSPEPGLKDLLTGMLTLLDWQGQLLREALGRLDDRDDDDAPPDPCPQGPQSR